MGISVKTVEVYSSFISEFFLRATHFMRDTSHNYTKYFSNFKLQY